MHYLITGGTGFIGRSFIKQIDLKVHQITVLTRNKRHSWPEVRMIHALEEVMDHEKIDVIINLAGAPIGCLWTQQKKRLLMQSRVGTTQALVALLKRLEHKPDVMLSASAIGYYGAHMDQDLYEESEAMDSFSHQMCQAWEQEAQCAQAYGVRVCIMRLAVVLGKDEGALKQMVYPFRMGMGAILGTGKQMFSWVHIEDVVSAMTFCIQNETACGVFNVSALSFDSYAYFSQTLAQCFGKKVYIRVPSWCVRMMLGEMGQALLLSGNKIHPKRLIDAGYTFKYTHVLDALSSMYKY